MSGLPAGIVPFRYDYRKFHSTARQQRKDVDLGEKADCDIRLELFQQPSQRENALEIQPDAAQAPSGRGRQVQPDQFDRRVEIMIDGIGRIIEGDDRHLPPLRRPVIGDKAYDSFRATSAQSRDDECDPHCP